MHDTEKYNEASCKNNSLNLLNWQLQTHKTSCLDLCHGDAADPMARVGIIQRRATARSRIDGFTQCGRAVINYFSVRVPAAMAASNSSASRGLLKK